MNKVYLFGADKPVNLNNRNNIKQAIADLFENENTSLERINYIFCSDEYLLDINRKHLNHDFFTDVITFSLQEKNSPVNGEVYLSVDRIKENANAYKVPYQHELLRIMFHGALHLCGYDDKSNSAKLRMREREDYYLSKLDVSREANS